jgi:2-polyprenyl-3-methyl-5-hydroxy-6-metoxy-1,4-benzoquinol methylase
MKSLRQYWNNRFDKYGHTGWKIPVIYKYDQKLRFKSFTRILNNLKYNTNKKVNALDIGCGSGDFIRILNDYNMNITGIDISEKAVKHVQNIFKNNNSVKVYNQDIINLQNLEKKFDLIISITVLQHVLNHNEKVAVLKVLNKIIESSGYLILLESIEKGKEKGKEFYINHKTKQEWVSLFESTNFKVVSIKSYPYYGLKLLNFINNILKINKISKNKVPSDNLNDISTKNNSKIFVFFIKCILLIT